MDDEKIKSEIGSAWSEESEFYDTHVTHKISSDTEKKLWMDVFSSLIPEEKNLNVLDVGCGTGAMGLIFSEMGHNVRGIDLSDGMMNVGKKKAADLNFSMTFEKGDAENPPFDDNTFDVVVNRHLLWTLPHPETSIHNWYRVLKPYGVLMVIDGVWDDNSKINNLRKKISYKIASKKEKHPHGGKSRYSDELISYLPNKGGTSEEKAVLYFENAGFENIQVTELESITKEQRKYLTWYQKISPKSTYYLISGRKFSDVGEVEVKK